ncbi:MAG TPA: hypothetical protein VFN92_04090 [Solirubrobacterales bacterium]|nr:hypothetical protein [Solirubrobacterales bacterium]
MRIQLLFGRSFLFVVVFGALLSLATVVSVSVASAAPTAGSYIVVLKDDVAHPPTSPTATKRTVALMSATSTEPR